MAYLIFIIGLIFGSFYLVIATRLPKGEDVLFSRSHCDTCKKELKWYNLIPVFSYIIQKGKCSFCQAKIPIEHLLTEIITGTAFLICYLVYGFSYEFFEGIVVISLTILIYISDFKYMVILDSTLIGAIILTILIKLLYFGFTTTIHSILSGIALFVVMLSIQKIGEFIFKKEALGGGDVKLAFTIGLIVDFPLGLATLILSTFLALPYAIASVYLIKKNEVAYGPFLAGALIIVFFTIQKFQILIDFLFPFYK